MLSWYGHTIRVNQFTLFECPGNVLILLIIAKTANSQLYDAQINKVFSVLGRGLRLNAAIPVCQEVRFYQITELEVCGPIR